MWGEVLRGIKLFLLAVYCINYLKMTAAEIMTPYPKPMLLQSSADLLGKNDYWPLAEAWIYDSMAGHPPIEPLEALDF